MIDTLHLMNEDSNPKDNKVMIMVEKIETLHENNLIKFRKK